MTNCLDSSFTMRTVDPDLWFRNIRKSSEDTWALEETDAHFATRLRHSLEDALGEFWLRCSARRLKLVDPLCATECGRLLRKIWAATVSITIAMSVVLYCVRTAEQRARLEVTLQSWQEPVTTVPFPAVAICSNNLVSKRKLDELTRSLSKRLGNYSMEAIKHHLLHFAAIVTATETEKKVDYELSQLILDTVSNNNVTDIMYQLAPKCLTLLWNCAWRGLPEQCWKLFAMRPTPLGYCCVFNGRYHPEDVDRPPKILDQIGQSNGLVVVFKFDAEDDAYLQRQTNTGIEVLIFDGTEYPLLESGVTRLFPLQPNSSMFFSIKITSQTTSSDLDNLNEDWLGCRLRDVHASKIDRRSYTWCVLKCRQWYSNNVCGCVPFTALPRTEHTICMPYHISCLQNHKDSLKYQYPLYTTEESHPGLDEELQDSISCGHCVRDCARPDYSAEAFRVPYDFEDKLFRGLETNRGTKSFWNTTMMRFFYKSKNHELYLVKPNVLWFEDIGITSCLWVLFVNFSIMCIAELVFHVSVRWRHHLLRRGRRNSRRKARVPNARRVAFKFSQNLNSETTLRVGVP